MSKIMRELVAEGRKARGIASASPPTEQQPDNTAGDWPFPGNAPTPVGPSAVCIHGIGMFDRCYACGRWGGAVDGDGDPLSLCHMIDPL
jgi:hypothetical protein